MAVGKRYDTTEPLTEHDVAERLSKAALRVWRIMYDLRVNSPELVAPVKSSRYWSGAVNHLLDESLQWHLRPWRMSKDDNRTPTEQVLIDRELLRQVIEHVQEARSGSIDPGLRQTYGLRRKRLLDQLHALLEETP